MSSAAATGDEAKGAPSSSGSEDNKPRRFAPEELLAALSAVPADKHTFASASLLEQLTLQKAFLTGLAGLASVAQENVQLSHIDALLCTFLKQVYCLVVALPGALQFDALEVIAIKAQLLGSHLASPFLGPLTPDGTLVIGVPEHHDAKCDTVSEICRLATAAVLTYYHYTNFPTNQHFCTADDACLLFTTMAINSLQDPTCGPLLAKGLKDLGDPITVPQLRWLMHYFRGQLWGLFGQVNAVTEDMKAMKQHLGQQQTDFLAMMKVLPECPASYLYYVKSCLQFQQMRPAELFATKGAVVAAKHNAHFYAAGLAAMRGVALALGARGDNVKVGDIRAAATEAQGAAGGATEAEAEAEALRKERAVLPEPYHSLLSLDPDMSILKQRILPAFEGKGDGEEVPVLDMLYTIPPPTAVPRGAVPAGAGEGAAGAETIAEGEEGEEQ